MAVSQSGMSLRDRPKTNACVIVLEWKLSSSKHTDGGFRMKIAFSHVVETDTSLIRYKAEWFRNLCCRSRVEASLLGTHR